MSRLVRSPQTASAPLPLGRVAVHLALGLLFAICLIRPPEFDPPTPGGAHPSQRLTPSWEQGLAHLFRVRAQAGVDYVFTYGPLGWLGCLTYDPELFWLRYGWEVALTGLLATVLLLLAHGVREVPLTMLLLLSIAVFEVDFADTRLPFLMLALAAQILRVDAGRWWVVLATGALATLAWIKFTLLILAVTYVAIAFVGLALAGRRRPALMTVIWFLAFLAVTWLLAGQRLSSLPAYLRGSLEIARGYNEAMAMVDRRAEIFWPGGLGEIAVALGLIVTTAILWCLSESLKRPRPMGWSLALLMLAGGFMQWKLGFTRRDGHERAFFTFGLLLPYLILACWTQRQSRRLLRWGLVGLTTLLSAVGIQLAHTNEPLFGLAGSPPARWAHNAAYLFAPWLARHDLQAAWSRDRHESPSLPRSGAIVRDKTVDLFSFRQGILFSQQMNWKPRPVFQGYSAYTPYLLDLNADFFRDQAAPKWLFFADKALDGRLYATEDSQALLEVLRLYQPFVQDGDAVLFRQASGTPPTRAPFQSLLERTVSFDEIVSLDDLPGGPQALSADIELSWWGRALALVYQPPPVWIWLDCGDGVRLLRRLVPSMVRRDFLFNPFVDGPQDLPGIYRKGALRRVRAFKILVFGDERCYKNRIRITLKSVPDLVPSARPLAP